MAQCAEEKRLGIVFSDALEEEELLTAPGARLHSHVFFVHIVHIGLMNTS
jgi:hypothetical protein